MENWSADEMINLAEVLLWMGFAGIFIASSFIKAFGLYKTILRWNGFFFFIFGLTDVGEMLTRDRQDLMWLLVVKCLCLLAFLHSAYTWKKVRQRISRE